MPSRHSSWHHTLEHGSVWPAAIAHGVNNATAVLMVWFYRGPVDLLVDPLIGPSMTGIIGSLGWVVLALPIFFIPGALAPTAGPQAGRSTFTSSTLEGNRV